MRKVVPLILLGLGVFLLTQVLMPELAFKIWEVTAFGNEAPLVDPASANTQVPGVSVENIGNFPAFISTNFRSTLAPYSEFRLSIPKLNLENIKVLVDSNTFENSLAQLPGTALPGERGNVFITGHSSLPQFFRPDNFKAIFANLPNIKVGDDILINALGQQFDYQVMSLRVVDPSDTWVINPPDQLGRYLTLMTCVPPGFNIKRLIVLSRLKEE